MKKVRILALVSAAATALLLFIFLNSLSKPADTDTANIIVAASDIPADTLITAAMVKMVQLPAEAVVAGAISDQGEIVGKISNTEIFAGEQILRAKLISTGESGSKTLAYAIEPGMRAISIAVDETAGLAYMIAPGDRVDIIGEFLGREPSGTEETEDTIKISHTVLVLENITVLAVDNVLDEDGKISSDKPAYTTLTLQVTPKQALELSEAEFEGQLRAVLRSPVDTEVTGKSSVTLNDIMVK